MPGYRICKTKHAHLICNLQPNPRTTPPKRIKAEQIEAKRTCTTMAPKMPSLKDSTSMSALSDSTTTMGSPLATLSPGLGGGGGGG